MIVGEGLTRNQECIHGLWADAVSIDYALFRRPLLGSDAPNAAAEAGPPLSPGPDPQWPSGDANVIQPSGRTCRQSNLTRLRRHAVGCVRIRGRLWQHQRHVATMFHRPARGGPAGACHPRRLAARRCAYEHVSHWRRSPLSHAGPASHPHPRCYNYATPRRCMPAIMSVQAGGGSPWPSPCPGHNPPQGPHSPQPCVGVR